MLTPQTADTAVGTDAAVSSPRNGRDRELELKLHFDPAAQSLLIDHPAVVSRALAPASIRELHSVYYDTAAHALAGAGLALRVRRVGNRFVQTLKAQAAGAALFERQEVECEVSGERPQPARIPNAELRHRVQRAASGEPLIAALTTSFARTERRLRIGDTELLFDLDDGEIRTERGSLPIRELELELVSGSSAGLYELALELLDDVPLRVGVASKLERGLALLRGETPPVQRARRPELTPGVSQGDAFRAALHSGLHQLLGNDAAARDGRDPGGVHQLRVGIRRLRAALALFPGLTTQAERRSLNGALRWLAGELGPARDLDVFVIETLKPLAGRTGEKRALARLRGEAEVIRGEAYERVRAALDSRRHAALALRLGRLLAGPLPREDRDALEALTPVLSRLHARSLRRGRHIRRRSVEEKHRLRIQLKKLRYSCEFARGLAPEGQAADFIEQLSKLQDRLGHLNDVATAERVVAELRGRLGARGGPDEDRAVGFVVGWVARAAADQLAKLPSCWKSFAKAEPFWL